MLKRLMLVLIVTAVSIAFFGKVAFGSNGYPSKRIKVVVPFKVGGASDITLRIMGKYIKKYLGANYVVVNIIGGGGSIGAREVLKSKPDGYAVLWINQSIITSYHTGVADFNFDDLTPVCQGLRTGRVVISRADASWNNLKDAIEDAKNNRNRIRLCAEIGATSHFQVIPILIETDNAFILTASSGGDMDRITKILGGHVDLSPVALSAAISYFKSKDLKALSVLSPERDPFLPDVPTALEQGIDAEFTQYMGFYMPPETPESIVRTFSKAIEQVLKDKGCLKELAEKAYALPAYKNQKAFTKDLFKEDAKFYFLARVAGLEPKRLKRRK
ncbi:MAG: tripartite tricarboxylate transporter substrate binding protein [Planctomycetota bacterium]|jgi:tripartite-type tricarboxylate transporter receptor subunit TctC